MGLSMYAISAEVSLSSAHWSLRRATHAVPTARSSVLIGDAVVKNNNSNCSWFPKLKLHGICGLACFVKIGSATICKTGFKLQNCFWAMWRAWGEGPSLRVGLLRDFYLINLCFEWFFCLFFSSLKKGKNCSAKWGQNTHYLCDVGAQDLQLQLHIWLQSRWWVTCSSHVANSCRDSGCKEFGESEVIHIQAACCGSLTHPVATYSLFL